MSDEEWALVAPYLVLLSEDAGQRRYPLRAVFNGLRYLVRTGAHWRILPHELPPWPVVYQRRRSAGWPRAASRRWCMIRTCCWGRWPIGRTMPCTDWAENVDTAFTRTLRAAGIL